MKLRLETDCMLLGVSRTALVAVAAGRRYVLWIHWTELCKGCPIKFSSRLFPRPEQVTLTLTLQ